MKLLSPKTLPVVAALSAIGLYNCSQPESTQTVMRNGRLLAVGCDSMATLPDPYATPSVSRPSSVVAWPMGKTPTAPAGFTVTEYARGLSYPRWTYVLPNGDVLVAQAATSNSANRITLFRDTNKDGKPDASYAFMSGLNKPLGMAYLGGYLFIANTDGLMRYPYTSGQTKITTTGTKILTLPAGGYNNHWTRNVIANPAGTKLYVSVGSASNVGEYGMQYEVRRAGILEINPNGTSERIYASGLRNPVGMAWQPGTGTLWTAVNERDGLGDELVPDYITSVKDGGFYGWPYSYYGQREDPRRKGERPDLVASALVPDFALGSHTASLGLAFYDKTRFPAKYLNGAFVGQHGSWNRSTLAGYKVLYVPFVDGKPCGQPEDFLTGFIANASTRQVYGRPAGVTVMPDGALLVADDAGGRIWRVQAN
ncbi:NHL repeat-containing protein [Fibrella aestuarina BUZ 2]|uniref:NHL repeat-containing protein n=1 Tax=Fibrella aestuarina BUZ 2 TaxID=1166018 RepID=I0KA28_9BACT|nr:NHL repeat-containing protein [Fibrella aestuarina BUZ 2]